MTKVQIRFHVEKPLDEAALSRVAEAQAIYGIERIKIEGVATDITVEYDASRLKASEVEAALRARGIPVVRDKKETGEPQKGCS